MTADDDHLRQAGRTRELARGWERVPGVGVVAYTGPSLFSGHGIDNFIRCPQLYAYKKVLKCFEAPVEPDIYHFPGGERDPLVKGSMGHQGLAQWYMRKLAPLRGQDPNIFATPEAAVTWRAEQNGPAWTRWTDLVLETLRVYFRHWDVDPLQPVAVEEELEIHVDGKWPLSRSGDLFAVDTRDRSGRIGIIDHKFVGYITDKTVKRYALSGQFLDYTLMGRAFYGDRFAGAFLNLIQWPRTRRDGTPVQPLFKRVPVPAAPWALRFRPEVLREAYEHRQQLIDDGVDPWSWPKRLVEQVCNGSYGPCDGYDICREGPAASPGHSSLLVLP